MKENHSHFAEDDVMANPKHPKGEGLPLEKVMEIVNQEKKMNIKEEMQKAKKLINSNKEKQM